MKYHNYGLWIMDNDNDDNDDDDGDVDDPQTQAMEDVKNVKDEYGMC